MQLEANQDNAECCARTGALAKQSEHFFELLESLKQFKHSKDSQKSDFYLCSISNSQNWITWACKESLAINQSEHIWIDKDGRSSLKGQLVTVPICGETVNWIKSKNTVRTAVCKRNKKMRDNKNDKSLPICTDIWRTETEVFEMNENSNGSFGQTLNEAPSWGSMVREFLNQPHCLLGVFVTCFSVPSAFLKPWSHVRVITWTVITWLHMPVSPSNRLFLRPRIKNVEPIIYDLYFSPHSAW